MQASNEATVLLSMDTQANKGSDGDLAPATLMATQACKEETNEHEEQSTFVQSASIMRDNLPSTAPLTVAKTQANAKAMAHDDEMKLQLCTQGNGPTEWMGWPPLQETQSSMMVPSNFFLHITFQLHAYYHTSQCLYISTIMPPMTFYMHAQLNELLYISWLTLNLKSPYLCTPLCMLNFDSSPFMTYACTYEAPMHMDQIQSSTMHKLLYHIPTLYAKHAIFFNSSILSRLHALNLCISPFPLQHVPHVLPHACYASHPIIHQALLQSHQHSQIHSLHNQSANGVKTTAHFLDNSNVDGVMLIIITHWSASLLEVVMLRFNSKLLAAHTKVGTSSNFKEWGEYDAAQYDGTDPKVEDKAAHSRVKMKFFILFIINAHLDPG